VRPLDQIGMVLRVSVEPSLTTFSRAQQTSIVLPHLAWAEVDIEFPNREAQALRSEPAFEDLLTRGPSIFVARDSLTHNT